MLNLEEDTQIHLNCCYYNLSIELLSQPFLGRHIWFHIVFHRHVLGLHAFHSLAAFVQINQHQSFQVLSSMLCGIVHPTQHPQCGCTKAPFEVWFGYNIGPLVRCTRTSYFCVHVKWVVQLKLTKFFPNWEVPAANT